MGRREARRKEISFLVRLELFMVPPLRAGTTFGRSRGRESGWSRSQRNRQINTCLPIWGLLKLLYGCFYRKWQDPAGFRLASVMSRDVRADLDQIIQWIILQRNGNS